MNSLILCEKLKRIPNVDYWRTYIHTPGTLKTQQGVMQKIKILQEQHNSSLESKNIEKLSIPTYPINRVTIQYNTELIQKVKKQHKFLITNRSRNYSHQIP